MTLHHELRAAAGNSSGSTDPYFNNVSLLLHGDGTNGAQNNTFLDSSSNNFTITRNGNTTQGSLSPYGTAWSNYFDGSGDYLTLQSNAALAPGAGDFCIETFAYMNATMFYGVLYSTQNVSSGFDSASCRIITGPSDNTIIFAQGASTILLTSAAITTNAWHHIAVTRSGTSLKMFIDGAQAASTTDSTNFSYSTSPVIAAAGASYFWNGYISNLRIVKGTAVYTSNFTPPTAPLTAISGTSLLTCQSNRFIDNSSNNFTLTPYGNVAVQSFSPYLPTAAYNPAVNGGSGYFDGDGDRLVIANAAQLNFSGDFTIELWVYATAFATYNTIITKGDAIFSGEWAVSFFYSKITFYAGGFQLDSINTDTVNTWYHVAVTRSGSTVRLFVNGILQSSGTSSVDYTSTRNLAIGDREAGSAYLQYPMTGYISNLRIVKGTAVYTSNFTPPTAPLTAVSGTSLLLNFTNAGIYDNAAKNDLETVGNAQVSTAVKKYGTGSMYFDGSGGYLVSRMSSDLVTFENGDFTIEMWIYCNDVTALQICYDQRPSGTQGAYPVIYVYSGTLRFQSNTTDLITTSVSTGQWYHIAVARSGNTTRLFKDGVSAGTYGTLINYLNGGDGRPGIGGGGFSTSTYFWNGYIDDLRITKGVARYTANFTPPTQAFPNQ